jgi:hypothetical protein
MKQVSKILANVNYDTSRIKLVKCVAAHNEADWIEANLSNNYAEYDIIRVIEGAVDGRPNSTPDGHSTDDTLARIRAFPDPENKIELITLNRPFKSLEEQKQLFIEFGGEDEFLFIVDCDEFYMDGDINRIRTAIMENPTASEFIPTFLHFYRDCQHIRDFGPEWVLNHQRIIKWRPGLRYHTHPVATQANGVCTYFHPDMQWHRYFLPIFIYHYGHAKGQEFHKMKADFYRSELAKFPAGEGKTAADAFDEKFKEFVNYTENLNEVLHFDGPHPSSIVKHNAFKTVDGFYANKQIKHWKKSNYYSQWPNLPTIPQWMWPGSREGNRMQPVFNGVEC